MEDRTAQQKRYEADLATLQSRFDKCQDPDSYQALHLECLERARFKVELLSPHVIQFAARTLLHNPSLWFKNEHGHTPSPELVARLQALLDMPTLINQRDNYYYPIVEGILHYIAGNYQAAFKAFAVAAQPNDFYRIVKNDFGGGASFAKAFPTNELLQSQAPLRNEPLRLHNGVIANSAVGEGKNILVAFDLLYALAFAEDWISYAANAAEPINLHFIISFRRNADFELLDRFAALAQQKNVRLVIHFEVDIKFERAYFASTRFLYLPTLIKQYGSFLTVDADVFPKERLNLEAFADISTVSGALTSGPYNGYLPWRRFSACYCFVPNNQLGITFADTVAHCISYFWDRRGDRNWWIDQMSLEVARIVQESPVKSANQLFWKFHETGEDYKKTKIAKVPRIAKLLASGVDYWTAVRNFYSEDTLT